MIDKNNDQKKKVKKNKKVCLKQLTFLCLELIIKTVKRGNEVQKGSTEND